MPTAFLSIDWDYFVREDPMWDWGHSESWGGPMAEILWMQQIAAMYMQGLDPVEEMDPDNHANPLPETFFDVLRQLDFDFTAVDGLWVSESHGAAYLMFATIYDDEVWPPDIIFNFDAHHDLGYKGFESLVCASKEGRIQCEDWLAHLLLAYDETEVRVILPDWERSYLKRAREELKEALPPSRFGDAVAIDTFTNKAGKITPLLQFDEEVEVTGVFISRSGSWAPPFLDKRFIRFVNRAEQATFLPAFVYRQEGWPNPLKARPFDLKAAKKLAEQQMEMLAQFRAERGK
jgi:hypothetical protein